MNVYETGGTTWNAHSDRLSRSLDTYERQLIQTLQNYHTLSNVARFYIALTKAINPVNSIRQTIYSLSSSSLLESKLKTSLD